MASISQQESAVESNLVFDVRTIARKVRIYLDKEFPREIRFADLQEKFGARVVGIEDKFHSGMSVRLFPIGIYFTAVINREKRKSCEIIIKFKVFLREYVGQGKEKWSKEVEFLIVRIPVSKDVDYTKEQIKKAEKSILAGMNGWLRKRPKNSYINQFM